MNAQDIRTLNERMQENILNAKSVGEQEAGFKSLLLSLLSEIAAQLAEANENLKKIANPLMVVENASSPWVWLKNNQMRYAVHRDEVASISAPKDNQCVVLMKNEGGEDPGRWCDGTLEEICGKLGIPLEEK